MTKTAYIEDIYCFEFALLKRLSVISTKAMRSIAKWRNLHTKQISRLAFCSLEMTNTVFSTKHFEF